MLTRSPQTKTYVGPAYEYDIKACYPRILRDVLSVKLPQLEHFWHDKEKRSRIVGLVFKANPDLVRIVRQVTSDILDDYISQVGEDKILLRKGDGFVSTTKLINTTCSLLDIELRYSYDILILYNKSYIGLADNEVIIKGVMHKTVGLVNFWKPILQDLSLQKLQQAFVDYMRTTDYSLFAIPVEDRFLFLLRDSQTFETKSYKNKIIPVDRMKYYRMHLLPFYRSVLMDTLQNQHASWTVSRRKTTYR